MALAIQSCVALITGSASGLGRATVEYLIGKGIRGVIAFDSKPHEYKISNNVITVQGNVLQQNDIEKALSICKQKFGALNVVVNCAGIAVANRMYNFQRREAQPLDEMRKVIETNCLGTFNVNRLAVGLIGQTKREGEHKHRFSRGIIINTSGISAFDGSVGHVVQAAANGAINSMTLPMARDLGVEGIRVVTIAAGFFKTALLDSMPENALKYLSQASVCPQRLGNAEEYAQLVADIIENPLINGEVIRLDGGMRIPF
ncbi:3-hydroxyacyl-CoA dehydrogenase type-2-like protein [Leptotrombidium deliense]|uniref:3-hydroxyacyl-CoA dehydrogenase type-2-like protein n=1 Tax=Leptotrombidium deliense TaxID=299467 RepID=A0A443SV27_9ACAR|nr:3-hydroxyacyl-CoA dehydrogenase type-2-like protein [Leptotrombidium deliense]